MIQYYFLIELKNQFENNEPLEIIRQKEKEIFFKTELKDLPANF